MDDELQSRALAPERAAELLGVSLQKMMEWIVNGEIASVATDGGVRIPESDIVSAEVRSWFERGCELSVSPDTVDQAARCFRAAISINPRFNLAWFELGRLYYTWGRYYEADEPLRWSIELNPCFPAYMNYGLSCNLWGKYREAEEAFKHALKIVPEHAESRYQLGFAIMMTSFYDRLRMREAIEHFRKSLELRPDHSLTAHFLGESLVFHLEAFDEACKFVEEIEGRLPDAAQHIRRIIELNRPNRTFARC